MLQTANQEYYERAELFQIIISMDSKDTEVYGFKNA